MPRFRDAAVSYGLFLRASAKAGRKGQSTEWDVSGNCRKPVYREIAGRQALNKGMWQTPAPTHFIDLWVRCRKCDNCRAAKRFHWQQRAIYEVINAHRTWFVTLTMSLETHLRFQYSLKGWDDWSEETRNRKLIAKELAEVTKMFKRMRKAGHQFRYLLATELHESGYPHFHLLIHEVHPDTGFTVRELAGNGQSVPPLKPKFWPHGFVSAKLADGLAAARARYVTKYIAKDLDHRVRASQDYGIPYRAGSPLKGGEGGVSTRAKARF